jgi:hypothetical protein
MDYARHMTGDEALNEDVQEGHGQGQRKRAFGDPLREIDAAHWVRDDACGPVGESKGPIDSCDQGWMKGSDPACFSLEMGPWRRHAGEKVDSHRTSIVGVCGV